MNQFHGWDALAESASEVDDGNLAATVEKLREEVIRLDCGEPIGGIALHNGRYTLVVNGGPNWRHSEATNIRNLLEKAVELLPG